MLLAILENIEKMIKEYPFTMTILIIIVTVFTTQLFDSNAQVELLIKQGEYEQQIKTITMEKGIEILTLQDENIDLYYELYEITNDTAYIEAIYGE